MHNSLLRVLLILASGILLAVWTVWLSSAGPLAARAGGKAPPLDADKIGQPFAGDFHGC